MSFRIVQHHPPINTCYNNTGVAMLTLVAISTQHPPPPPHHTPTLIIEEA